MGLSGSIGGFSCQIGSSGGGGVVAVDCRDYGSTCTHHIGTLHAIGVGSVARKTYNIAHCEQTIAPLAAVDAFIRIFRGKCPYRNHVIASDHGADAHLAVAIDYAVLAKRQNVGIFVHRPTVNFQILRPIEHKSEIALKTLIYRLGIYFYIHIIFTIIGIFTKICRSCACIVVLKCRMSGHIKLCCACAAGILLWR